MKGVVWNWLVFTTTMTFFSGIVQAPMVLAFSENSQHIDLEVTVKVNQKGFLDHRGKLFGPQNKLNIPKNSRVRITFVFDEDMTSLAYGDTHQIAITAPKAWTKESEKIWMFSSQSSITFQTGQAGGQYRAYCIIDCIGMEHLNNLIIHIV